MLLRRLVIDCFRNLGSQQLDFCSHKNYLFGENAQGKTNLLEVIYLLCLCKSFRTASDAEMVPLGKEYFSITGHFIGQNSIEHEIHLRYQTASGKLLVLDGKPLHQLSRLVGQFPVVVLSVADYDITHGSPQQRRRFFNILASQCSTRYLNDLKEYDKIIKQRNRILWLGQNSRMQARDDLAVWDEQLISRGTALMRFRQRLVAEMSEVLASRYQRIAGDSDARLTITYQPNVTGGGEAEMEQQFAERLRQRQSAEAARGVSLVGPHRDDFLFQIGPRPLRQYGSRGEHKSALISLKAAELDLLKRHLQMTPLLLLDDLYAELDQERGERVIDLFSEEGQCFISGTSADYASLQHRLQRGEREELFLVGGGEIRRAGIGEG
ncbi:MAG TPA: DNA replication/repair protein RecF [bacterium]|nr:DNA replication/repair protein RecF [bacterium]HPR86505.1 DNA replication/repair protein RecF [bacterium]